MWAWPIAVISCVPRAVAARPSSAGPGSRGRPGVAEAVELAQQLAAPRAVGVLVHQRRQHAEVARERPRVADRSARARSARAGTPAGPAPAAATAGSARPSRTARCRRSRHSRAAAPAARARGEHRVGAVAARAAHQALDRLAVDPQRRLGVRHQEQVDLLARPRLRHRASTSSHHVAHSGPSSIPSSASRSTPSGPVIRSREHGRVSGYTSAAACRAAWRTRSRV